MPKATKPVYQRPEVKSAQSVQALKRKMREAKAVTKPVTPPVVKKKGDSRGFLVTVDLEGVGKIVLHGRGPSERIAVNSVISMLKAEHKVLRVVEL